MLQLRDSLGFGVVVPTVAVVPGRTLVSCTVSRSVEPVVPTTGTAVLVGGPIGCTMTADALTTEATGRTVLALNLAVMAAVFDIGVIFALRNESETGERSLNDTEVDGIVDIVSDTELGSPIEVMLSGELGDGNIAVVMSVVPDSFVLVVKSRVVSCSTVCEVISSRDSVASLGNCVLIVIIISAVVLMV